MIAVVVIAGFLPGEIEQEEAYSSERKECIYCKKRNHRIRTIRVGSLREHWCVGDSHVVVG